jgi:hypothetical protein
MTTELVEDKDQLNLLVKRNGKVIANYPFIAVKLLKEKFKDICLSSEFSEYESLDDFVNSIYFLEFFEYFLDYLHSLFPDEISYEKYKTNINSVIIKNIYFRDIINMCSKYVFNYIDINMLYTQLQHNINSINLSTLSLKLKKVLLRLYYGLLYFTKSVMNNEPTDYTNLLLLIKKAVVYNSNKVSIKNSKVELLCSNENTLEYRKNLLSKFRLFQRKYLSSIAKLRRIGPPNATNKESREIKKELNKNKNVVDYKAYEIFCKYVLSKEENEDIYDYLAGIHKNTFKGVIHKNINNNTVANIKANTKKTHHKEYLERSEAILKMVEAKIEKHGDIIDKEIKSQVGRIRKLFDSKQFKNLSLSFGNENSPSIGGKIIHDCKRIRSINKQIDKIIKEHEQRKEVNNKNTTTSKFLSDLLEKHPEIKNEPTLKKKIYKLLLKYHPNKRQGLTNNERKETVEITKKLTELLK